MDNIPSAPSYELVFGISEYEIPPNKYKPDAISSKAPQQAPNKPNKYKYEISSNYNKSHTRRKTVTY